MNTDHTTGNHETGACAFAIYRGREGLAKLREPWRSLADSLSSRRFIHFFSWYSSYLDSLESDPEAVFFVAISRGPQLIAVIPLKRTTRRIAGISLRYLELPVHTQVDLGDLVFEKSAENAALLRETVTYLRRLTGQDWDIVEIPYSLEDSVAAYAIERAPPPLTITAQISKSGYLDCSVPYEQCAGNFKGHFRRNIRRFQRRAQERGTLAYRSYSSVEDVRRHFTEFLEVEASGWKGQQGRHTAIACEQSTILFYEELIDGFGPSGQCLLTSLTLDDKCIASQLCLTIDGTVYILKIGYDQSLADIAPGNLNMHELIRECANDDRIHTVNFVTHHDWNALWGAEAANVYTHRVFNYRTLRGLSGYALCKGQQAVKRVVPKRLKARIVQWRESRMAKPEENRAASS